MPAALPSSAIAPSAAMLSLGRTAVDILRTRVDLVSVELTQEKIRCGWLALHGGLALVSLFLCLQALAALLVAGFWDTPYRLSAIACVGAVFAAAAAICLMALARRAQASPRPFEGTLQALATDIDAFG